MMWWDRSIPDHERALEIYRIRARSYDGRLSSKIANVRAEAINILSPKQGDVVLEVGCGTGKNLALIRERVGVEGRVIGLDQSPDMLALARRKIDENGWGNVHVLLSTAEQARIDQVVDAVFFYATHDILRSRRAIENVLAAARSGARVVAAGTQWAPRWNLPVNLYLWIVSRRYITTFEGYSRPWDILAELVPNLQVQTNRFGAIFIAYGTIERPVQRV